MNRRVTLVLLTYARTDYAKVALASFLAMAQIDRARTSLGIHIADDGSDVVHQQTLWEIAAAHVERGLADSVTFTDSQRGGYGRNVNLATQAVHHTSNYVFMLEDDWQLYKSMDLDAYLDDMEAMPEVGCVRLGYLSWTQQMRGWLANAAENRKYLVLDPASAEPHVFAGHPRLETVAFQRAVGAWPEGLAPGATEFAVAHRAAARTGVAWPIGLDARQDYGIFAHIGTVPSIAVPEPAHA